MPAALIVADAAYMGYELARAILQTRRSFLRRMSSKVDLYTAGADDAGDLERGPACYGPPSVQKPGEPPMACRLIRVPTRAGPSATSGSVTDILDPARSAAATAAQFYRWRWRNEGVFRIYKRTINKLKLSRRTVRLVHREAEVSLLAVQILLAHADLALRPRQTVRATR